MISDSVTNRIVVFSGKGGVGKTTVAVNLACLFSQRSHQVGLLDADITGPNVLQMMGISEHPQAVDEKLLPHERHGIKVVSLASLLPANAPVIWRGPMRSKAVEQLMDDTEWGDIDTLIMDLPPGTGDEALTVAQKASPQLAIVVTTPQEVALLDARRAINFAKELKIPTIAIIENMAGLICPHCGERVDLFGTGGGLAEAIRQDIAFLGDIPIDPAARIAGDSGTPFVIQEPTSNVANAFGAIVDKIIDLLNAGD